MKASKQVALVGAAVAVMASSHAAAVDPDEKSQPVMILETLPPVPSMQPRVVHVNYIGIQRKGYRNQRQRRKLWRQAPHNRKRK